MSDAPLPFLFSHQIRECPICGGTNAITIEHGIHAGKLRLTDDRRIRHSAECPVFRQFPEVSR